jgi:hypothetical protein
MKKIIIILFVLLQSIALSNEKKALNLPDKHEVSGHVVWKSIVSIDGKQGKQKILKDIPEELIAIKNTWSCGIPIEQVNLDSGYKYHVRQITCVNVITRDSIASFTGCSKRLPTCETYLAIKSNGKNYGFFLSGTYVEK